MTSKKKATRKPRAGKQQQPTFAGLHAAGYEPLPANKKEVRVTGWPTLDVAQHIEEWDRGQVDGPYDGNIGLRCSTLRGFDIDVLDEALAQAIEDAIRAEFKLNGTPTRTGLAPKRLIPLRTAEPYRKRQVMMHKDGLAKPYKVEVLGDGQQFIAFGTHPDTGKPYQWSGDLPKFAQLPEVTEADIGRMLEIATALAVEHGYATKAPEKAQEPRPEAGESKPSPTGEPLAQRLLYAAHCLNQLPNETDGALDWDQWKKVAGILHHFLPDAPKDAQEMFDGFSQRHPRYDAKATRKAWKDARTFERVTFGSLMEMARKALGDPDWHPADAGQRPTKDAPPLNVQDFGGDIMDVLANAPEPAQAIIEGLLYPGMTAFDGKAKEGKSFALMQAACAVASGARLWDTFNILQPTGVVMFCAEDYGARLKKRFEQHLHEGRLPKPPKGRLHVLIREDIEKLAQADVATGDPDGRALIEALIDKHIEQGRTVFIFDTLERVEALLHIKHAKTNDVKERDYVRTDYWNRLAESKGIAIIGSGHLRKGRGSSDAGMDPMDLVNRTGASNAGISHFWALVKLPSQLSGDALFDDNDGKKERMFFATGREIERDVKLHFVQGSEGMGGLWVNRGNVLDVYLTDRGIEYLNALEMLQGSGSAPVTSKAIAEACDSATPKAVQRTLNRLLQKYKYAGERFFKGRALACVMGSRGGWRLVA